MIDQIVTIIGDSFIEPICTLLEKIENYVQPNESPIGSGYYVNGYSVSICLLSVACLESYAMRVRYLKKAKGFDLNKSSVGKYFSKVFDNFLYDDEINEIFILRDIITHNHLWEFDLYRDENGIKALKEDGKSSGDSKYLNYVDLDSKTTKKLGLTIIPTHVGKRELIVVLKTVWKILLFLENDDSNQCSVSHMYHKYKGRMRGFGEIIELAEANM